MPSGVGPLTYTHRKWSTWSMDETRRREPRY